jgi:hypothetical protein
MAEVRISDDLLKQIEKTFKKQSIEVIEFLQTLEDSPHKGTTLGNVRGIIIKELKYSTFRFYFIHETNCKIYLYSQNNIREILIKVIAMSKKNDQQDVINKVKKILRDIGPDGFN